jgi:hypothetical protein
LVTHRRHQGVEVAKLLPLFHLLVADCWLVQAYYFALTPDSKRGIITGDV